MVMEKIIFCTRMSTVAYFLYKKPFINMTFSLNLDESKQIFNIHHLKFVSIQIG